MATYRARVEERKLRGHQKVNENGDDRKRLGGEQQRKNGRDGMAELEVSRGGYHGQATVERSVPRAKTKYMSV